MDGKNTWGSTVLHAADGSHWLGGNRSGSHRRELLGTGVIVLRREGDAMVEPSRGMQRREVVSDGCDALGRAVSRNTGVRHGSGRVPPAQPAAASSRCEAPELPDGSHAPTTRSDLMAKQGFFFSSYILSNLPPYSSE